MKPTRTFLMFLPSGVITPRKKVYFVVDCDGISVSPQATEAFRQSIERVMKDAAITIVRYGGSISQRSTGGLIDIKMHAPSNIYTTREEAISVVKKLREGSMQLAAVA